MSTYLGPKSHLTPQGNTSYLKNLEVNIGFRVGGEVIALSVGVAPGYSILPIQGSKNLRVFSSGADHLAEKTGSRFDES